MSDTKACPLCGGSGIVEKCNGVDASCTGQVRCPVCQGAGKVAEIETKKNRFIKLIVRGESNGLYI